MTPFGFSCKLDSSSRSGMTMSVAEASRAANSTRVLSEPQKSKIEYRYSRAKGIHQHAILLILRSLVVPLRTPTQRVSQRYDHCLAILAGDHQLQIAARLKLFAELAKLVGYGMHCVTA